MAAGTMASISATLRRPSIVDRHDLRPVPRQRVRRLARVRAPVGDVERERGRPHVEQPRGQEPERPEERDASDVADQQRRIAERRQEAAGVGDRQDEERDEVRAVLALAVGPQDGSDHQHARAGRPDEAREHGTRPRASHVRGRFGLDVSRDVNAARRDVEGAERRDEREIRRRRLAPGRGASPLPGRGRSPGSAQSPTTKTWKPRRSQARGATMGNTAIARTRAGKGTIDQAGKPSDDIPDIRVPLARRCVQQARRHCIQLR